MKTATNKNISVEVTIKFDIERIKDLLCAAFEGGTGYWCSIRGYKYPNGKTKDDYEFRHCEVVPDGGTMILVETEENREWELTQERLMFGLKVMSTQYPEHFNDFLRENEDATTGDVFVQCCLFGTIIYG